MIKRLVLVAASAFAAILYAASCAFLGAYLVRNFMPFAPDDVLRSWHAAATTALFVFGLSQCVRLLIPESFRKVEWLLLTPIAVYFVSSGIDSYTTWAIILFACGWMTIWRIITLRRRVTQ